jgi:hypothetical protein
MLSAHQQVAVRHAFRDARIDGPVIRLGRWNMVYTDSRLDLPTTSGPGGRFVDGCDEAMIMWMKLIDVLGRADGQRRDAHENQLLHMPANLGRRARP